MVGKGFADRVREAERDTETSTRANPVAGMVPRWPYRWWLPPVALAGWLWLATLVGHVWWGQAVTLTAGLCAALAAVVGWVRLPSLAGRGTSVAGLVLVTVWVGAAVAAGPWALPVLTAWAVGVIAATVVWARLSWVRHRVRDDVEARDWPTLAAALGIDDAALMSITRTRVGRKLTVSLAPGQTWRAIQLETAETVLGVAPGAVTVERDHTSARRVVIHVQDRDPWADGGTIDHPILAELDHLETTTTQADPANTATDGAGGEVRGSVWWPGSGTVRRPIPIGTRPDGGGASLPLWRSGTGALHWLVGGQTGSGKSIFYRDLLTGLARCNDVVVAGIDIGKRGKAFGPWTPVMHRVARDLDEAVAVLELANHIISASADASAAEADSGEGTDNVEPSPARPHLVVVVDEGRSLFDVTNADMTSREGELRYRAVELAEKIGESGRSEAVSLVVATQFPDRDSLGGGQRLRSHFGVRVCLRTAQQDDIRWVLDGAKADDLDPSMFRYPGLLYAQDGPDTVPVPIRSYSLLDPGDCRRIAAVLAPGMTTLPAWLHPHPTHTRGDTPMPPTDPTTTDTGMTGGTVASPDFGGGPILTDVTSSTTSTGSDRSGIGVTLTQIQADAAAADAEPESGVPPIPLDELALAHTPGPAEAEPGDDHATTALLDALHAAGSDGITRADLVTRAGVDTLTAIRLLGGLERGGHVTGSAGTGDDVRWHITDAATSADKEAGNA